MGRRSRLRRRAVVWFAALMVAALPTGAAGDGAPTGLASDGVWSWFTDPRAVYDDGVLYAGWVTKFGNIQVAACGVDEGQVAFDLELAFGPDDHDNPSFYKTSDGRITAFYSGHAVTQTHTLYRTTLYPADVTAWTPRDSTGVNTYGSAGVTYSNPLTIPGETDRIYLVWRGGDWKPAYAVGAYDPATAEWSWSLRGRLITVPIGRPYVKFAVGDDLIGLAFTDGHPYETLSNIYYAAIGKDAAGTESFFRADGSKIKPLSAGPLRPTEADTVFSRLADPDRVGDNSWVWDVAFEPSGRPVVAFATFPTHTDHQYHWARYDGTAWRDRILVENAGGSIADTTIGRPEYYYSGGLALDRVNPAIVYVSRGNDVGGWDIEQMTTSDGGITWVRHAITQNSLLSNVRPVVPWGRPEDTEMVLWLTGSYDHYENAETPPLVKEGEWICFRTNVRMWAASVGVTSVADGLTPSGLTSARASPSPFRDWTMVEYELGRPARASVRVYDVAGRLVATLADGDHTRGTHRASWDGRSDAGEASASGVYFVRVEAEGRALWPRVVLVR